MTISKIFSKGTIIAITAKAVISAFDANLLQYSWRRDGVVVTSVLTSGTATLITSTAGTYDVVVSHPNADTITSNSFNLSYREPEDIIRLIYQTGGFANIDANTGNFTSFQVIDWNIAEKEFEMGTGVQDAIDYGNPSGGWWRVFAKEKDLSLDVTLRGSCGGNNLNSRTSGQGGTGTLRRTFETNQLYTLRIGDRRSGADNDVQVNGPNGGRTFDGSGNFGGGQTYMKRGGTLVAVAGGGGGSATNADGGDGGGFNVAGESGQGNGRSGGRVVNPGTQSYSGYPRNFGVKGMSRCGLDARNGALLCTFENGASDGQNNGGWGDNNGGGGGSGLEGGHGGRSSNEAGCGGSGWASSAVTILSASLGGGGQDHNGSVRIRQTGFNNYIVQWYHTTGIRRGLIPTFNLTNNGNFTATVTPQNVGFETNQGPESSKHYLVEFEEPFLNTAYNTTFTFIGDLTAAGALEPTFTPIIFDKQAGSFRVKFADADGTPHIRETIFKVQPA
jgi:hypothetical protein